MAGVVATDTAYSLLLDHMCDLAPLVGQTQDHCSRIEQRGSGSLSFCGDEEHELRVDGLAFLLNWGPDERGAS